MLVAGLLLRGVLVRRRKCAGRLAAYKIGEQCAKGGCTRLHRVEAEPILTEAAGPFRVADGTVWRARRFAEVDLRFAGTAAFYLDTLANDVDSHAETVFAQTFGLEERVLVAVRAEQEMNKFYDATLASSVAGLPLCGTIAFPSEQDVEALLEL